MGLAAAACLVFSTMAFFLEAGEDDYTVNNFQTMKIVILVRYQRCAELCLKEWSNRSGGYDRHSWYYFKDLNLDYLDYTCN